ncbi:calcium channel protein [Ascosphaera aggregata]|nr:calcium channel protein [Ascosphaera aggregata]
MDPNAESNRNDGSAAQSAADAVDASHVDIPLQDLSNRTFRFAHREIFTQELNSRDTRAPSQNSHVSWHTQDLLPQDRGSTGSHGSRSFSTHFIGRGTQYTRLRESLSSPENLGYNAETSDERSSFDTVRLSVDLGNAVNQSQIEGAGPTPHGTTCPGTIGATVGPNLPRSSGSSSRSQQEDPYRDAIDDSADLTTYPHILTSPSQDELNQAPFVDSSEDTVPLTRSQQERQGRTRFAPDHHLQLGGAGSRLGDDLRRVEEGLHRSDDDLHSSVSRRHRHDRSRSLSPSNINKLGVRAGSMMRMMSQRVVNLGNEPEMVDKSLRARRSSRNRSHSREAGSRRGSAARQGSEPRPAPSGPSFDDITVRVSGASIKGAETPEKSPLSSPLGRRPPLTIRGRTSNPFKGRSLGIFGPDNKIRGWLCEILIHPITEPIILLLILLQTVLLSIEASLSVKSSSFIWSSAALDAAFFGLFVIYTLEIIIKSIVSGLIFNPEEYSTLDRSKGWKEAVVENFREIFMPHRERSDKKTSDPLFEPLQASIIRSFAGHMPERAANPTHQQRMRLARRAFLRHSFNRLDFIAVASYWIAFALAASHVETSRHIYVFRMMSCLRILRLMSLTTGTSVILLSLKKAAPMLINVAFLMGFFWLLFAIIGVQSFKSSFLRHCVWLDPAGLEDDYVIDNGGVPQFCGGYLDNITGHKMPWKMSLNELPRSSDIKGFICPRNSQCVQGLENPYNGTLSFDDIFHSLEAVFVIMSSNTFTDLLYYTTDSDYLAASLFFIAGYVILALWLVNLLVAVITSSFQLIREETKRSAFASDNVPEEKVQHESEPMTKVPTLKKLYDRTLYFWIVIIASDLVIQCLRSATMGETREKLIDKTEMTVTALLVVEIVFRFIAEFRKFHRHWRNWIDLFLAVITCVMQLPRVKNSRAYMGMTIFQIARAYRIVLAFTITRELVATVFRNAYGLANLILFVFLVTFLASIFAIQLFRGQVFGSDTDFNNIFNSFLGMYQILSSENWTDILYAATASTREWNTAWIAALFIIIWFMFANLVVLNMFIAVIQESFDLPEEDKRLEQMKAFVKKKHMGTARQTDISLSTIFGFKRRDGEEPLDRNHAGLDMLSMVVEEFLSNEPPEKEPPLVQIEPERSSRWGLFSNFAHHVRSRLWDGEPNPFYESRESQKTMHLRDFVKTVGNEDKARKQARREYLEKYPNYNVTLFLFRPDSRIRRLCQRIVGPGRGTERFDGVEPIQPLRVAFSTFIYAAIIAMVVIACVVSPLYQQKYYQGRDSATRPWFVWTDVAFAALFTVEVFIKVIADGFFWTPNAYFRGSWGFIDGLVLVTMWINVATAFSHDASVLRVVGAFRALRALRLLNLSTSARETFHAVIIKGWWKVISASFVAMSFLVPFAIYGLNLFNGQLMACNDEEFSDVFDSDLLDYCVGEFMDSPYNWDIAVPRVVSNSYYSFDTFPKSLFILFQIVSQEGWIDVLWDTMGINGKDRQPNDGAESAYGLFFVVFNLLGSVFVLTLFVSVFMRNYTEETGVAYLTSEQRSWQELRKMLLQVSPSKGPAGKRNTFQDWCYHIAAKKHGNWARFMTTLLCFHLILLVAEYRSQPSQWDTVQDIIFLVLHLFYIANIVIRITGLTWRRFRRSSWDVYGLIVITGSFITSMLEVTGNTSRGLKPTHKLLLVAVTLLLIPRNNQLDQLLKTGAASLPSIASLLATWFVLFLAYAIALTQIFGLTKFGSQENNNVNFRDVPRALILLFRTSCGEGWNEIMEDFAQMTYPDCSPADDFFDSDCGSLPWARALFISWNLISMYIFVSLFVSLVFENFSYVYQRSSGLTTLSRDELRRFKQAWAAYDPEGTGFINKENFPRFLKNLTGKFEMRIYTGQFTVSQFVQESTFVKGENEPMDTIGPIIKSIPKASTNYKEVYIDLGKLNRRVSRIPVKQIHKNRAKLEEFCEDVLVDSKVKGISFSSCIMTLAHYNMINEWQSMQLDELLRRLVRKQRVQETVRRKIVLNFINAWLLNKRYRDRRDGIRRYSKSISEPSTPAAVDIPEIFIENEEYLEPTTPPDSPEVGPQTPMLSPPSTTQFNARNRNNLPRLDTSVQTAQSPSERSPSFLTRLSNLSPAFSPRGRSMSPDDGNVSPTGHSDGESAISAHDVRNMLASLDASAWGESMRRSFASRRSNFPGSDRSPR